MIKDLVANLTVGADRDVAAEFAISIAEAFEAHIAGIAFAYDPVITPTVMDGPCRPPGSTPSAAKAAASPRRQSTGSRPLPGTGAFPPSTG